jgi:hypothetical protein
LSEILLAGVVKGYVSYGVRGLRRDLVFWGNLGSAACGPAGQAYIMCLFIIQIVYVMETDLHLRIVGKKYCVPTIQGKTYSFIPAY